jgi:phospholipase/lecithinase/hemolysin
MLAFWSRSFLTFCFFVGTFAQSASQWRGWDEIDNIFVFGDSYTATGFEPNGTQPNPSNAFGNPAFPGRTFSNGRNWIDFLTLNYNDSYVSTYNFARGGASIDSFGSESIFRPFDHQVDRFFLPFYAENNVNLTTWRPDNTLFATFFGINDVNFFYKMDNRTEYAALISDTYTKYMEKLYRAGARNFLIMNVPPIHRAPFTAREGDRNVARNKESVEDFNGRIMDMASGMVQKHEDIAVYLLDTYSLYNEVLNDPQSRTETTGYRNTTGSCPAYSRYVTLQIPPSVE